MTYAGAGRQKWENGARPRTAGFSRLDVESRGHRRSVLSIDRVPTVEFGRCKHLPNGLERPALEARALLLRQLDRRLRLLTRDDLDVGAALEIIAQSVRADVVPARLE